MDQTEKADFPWWIKVLSFWFTPRQKLHKYYQTLADKWLSYWYCRQFASCGKNFHLYGPTVITGAHAMHVGENVHINRGALLRAEGGLTIGNNVHIARNLTIYTINHNYKGAAIPYDHTAIKQPVTIGDNVWIGVNVTIVPGVTIGEGAIIGAGAVVAKDVPPLAIVGMQPIRILGYRDKAHYENLVAQKRFGGVSGRLYTPK